jgi:DNA-binding YbaB/EbfC family protein
VFKQLGQLGNIASLMKQAQQVSGRMQELNGQLRTQRVEGLAGGGMVRVEADGLGSVLRVKIDPAIAGDCEMIEDLLPAAINDAGAKAKQLHADAMRSLTADMNLPGLNEAFEQLAGPTDSE